jgi:NAD+ kinase
VAKIADKKVIRMTRDLTLWLLRTFGPDSTRNALTSLYIDSHFKDNSTFQLKAITERTFAEGGAKEVARKLKFWTKDNTQTLAPFIDYVITLGGDGTVLYTSWLFQDVVPPVIPFHMGSVGFLTPFDFGHYQDLLTKVLRDGVRVQLRMRMTCTVYRSLLPKRGKKKKGKRKEESQEQTFAEKDSNGDAIVRRSSLKECRKNMPPIQVEETFPLDDLASAAATKRGKEKPKGQFALYPQPGVAVETYEVLNDVVVDRGPSAYMSQLELFGDETHLTTVTADGLVVATPTGSTAYSLSAGGSICHPEVPAFLVSPICPHSLSFRPSLLPDGMQLIVYVPLDSRNTAWVCDFVLLCVDTKSDQTVGCFRRKKPNRTQTGRLYRYSSFPLSPSHHLPTKPNL